MDEILIMIEKMAAEFNAKPSAQRKERFRKKLHKFSNYVVQRAIDNICDTQRMMPTPAELVTACIEVQKGLQAKGYENAGKTYTCEYYDPAENQASKLLCEKSVSAYMHEVAKLHGWPIVCPWHHDVLQAKVFPGSTTAFVVSVKLETMNERIETGIIIPSDKR